jgi:outer membrane protein assembly factor BamB
MLEQTEMRKPWFRSWPFIVAASLLLPPVGVALILTNRDLDAPVKALGSVLVLLLGGLYAFLLLAPSDSPATSAHFDALERHREEQRRAAPPVEPQALVAAEQVAADSSAAVAAEGQTVVMPGAEAGPAADPGAAVVVNGAVAANGTATANGTAAPRRRNYWTQFRGPGRDGRYEEQAVKVDWPASGPPMLWRQPVGGGFASFSVANGVAYTIEQRRGQEVVAAYQVETGREVWTHGWEAMFRDSTGDGPRATPTWDGGRVYALGGAGELRCLDGATGRLVWSKNVLADNRASNLPWGTASSPLVVDDKVVVMTGAGTSQAVAAYNKTTGAPVWKALADDASYTSPMLVTLSGRRQVLVVTARRAAGLVPETGAVLWEFPWSNSAGINVAQPVLVSPTRFLLSAGYGKGAALVEVSGSGGAMSAAAIWQNGTMRNKFNSSVYHDGHVYGLSEGVLTCVEAATGERRWQARGYGYGQLVLAGSHLVVTTDEGEVAVVRATAAGHNEVARFKALEGQTWNNPAIAGGHLLVRNSTQMACFKLAD